MKTWSTIYGPVYSWRLGVSLGIDPLKPPKTCTFNCIYCQLGKTIKKVSKPEDSPSYVSVEKIVKDLKETLKRVDIGNIDYLTFSGAGEPTLNPNLAKIVREIRRLVNDKPIAILTNSSLLDRETVRENLRKIDLVIAKLDAPNQKLLKRINRPSKGITLDSIIEGLKKFRKETNAKLAIQTMFIKSTAKNRSFNTEKNVVEGLVKIIEKISPDEVQINIPTRPPSESHIIPPKTQEMEKILRIFRVKLSGIKIVSRIDKIKEKKLTKKEISSDLEERIIETLKRRPCSLQDLTKVFGMPRKVLDFHLTKLVSIGKVSVLKYRGLTYYRLSLS